MDAAKWSYSHTIQLWEDIFGGLYRVDANGDLQPEVVTSYTVSDDSLVYTFTLRDDVYWVDQNGERVVIDGVEQKVTANDLYTSWSRSVDPSTGALYGFIFEPILNAKEIMAG